MSNIIYDRCFIYSREQQETKTNIETSAGRSKPKFGSVIVKGVPKIYTDIITSMDKARYSDSILIIKGDIRTIKFTEPSS